MSKFLEGLNDSQRLAVETLKGPVLVIAGAGSGKTRVLTYRIAHMLETGADPKSVLSLTFTNKAAREMKLRIASLVGEDKARELWMGTFHSVFSRILRSEAELLGFPENFSIYDTQDSKQVINSIIKRMGLKETYTAKAVMSRISTAKNNLMVPSEYSKCDPAINSDKARRMPEIHKIYSQYMSICKEAGAMDFDDLLLMTNILFRDHPDALVKYQDMFKYVMVDEYQDTNYAQFLIVKKLVAKSHNICVVGDDAQSIYSFRGAKIENILNFETLFDGCKTFKLEQNYRSTQVIVDAANSVIDKNKSQLKKNTFSDNETGDKIKIMPALSEQEEGVLVMQEMHRAKERHSYGWSDFTILYRTNAQSRVFEELMRRQSVPYKIYGGLSFYQRSEVKDLLAYFRLCVNSLDNEAFKRVINTPKRGIGATTVHKIEEAAIFNKISFMEVASDAQLCQNAAISFSTYKKIDAFVEMINRFSASVNMVDAYELSEMVVRESSLIDSIKSSSKIEDKVRVSNLNELMGGIKDFSDNALEEGRSYRITDFIGEVALLTDQDAEANVDSDRVTLMTVHSSKGLEFKNVFIVGMEDKLFPSSFDDNMTLEAMEEERRLFYVALTRAEKRVWLSFAKQRFRHGKMEYKNESSFLSEIDPRYCELPTDHEDSYFSRRRVERDSIAEMRKSEHLLERERASLSIPSRTGPYASRAVNRSQSDENREFIPDHPSRIIQGVRVRHMRFGKGTVDMIEGSDVDRKATVMFDGGDKRVLLLKHARLKLI